MRVVARLSLLLLVGGGAAPASSLLLAPTPFALRQSGVRTSFSSRGPSTPAHPGQLALVAAEPPLGPIYPAVWCVASLATSAWFAVAYVASVWFIPFLHREQRSRWRRLAVVCTIQAFTGGPAASLVRRDYRGEC